MNDREKPAQSRIGSGMLTEKKKERRNRCAVRWFNLRVFVFAVSLIAAATFVLFAARAFTKPGPQAVPIIEALIDYPFLQGVDAPPASLGGTPPYFPSLVRQTNCSLTRVIVDSNLTVQEQDTNYQDFRPVERVMRCNQRAGDVCNSVASLLGRRLRTRHFHG